MKTLLFASLLGWASLTSANADFINLDSNVKIVYTQVILGGTKYTKATATTSVTDAVTGVITVKRQTEVKVPSPFGGFTKYETQETTVATPSFSGVTVTYHVQTSSVTITTPVSTNGTPTGDAVTTNPVLSDTTVDSGDLDLPAATTFQTIDEDLEVVISPA
jgi:hypothetical protein